MTKRIIVKTLGILATGTLEVVILIREIIRAEENKTKISFGLLITMLIVSITVMNMIKDAISRKAQSIDVAHELGIASKTNHAWITVVNYLNIIIPLLITSVLFKIVADSFQEAWKVMMMIVGGLIPSMVTFITNDIMLANELRDKTIDEKENQVMAIADEMERRLKR